MPRRLALADVIDRHALITSELMSGETETSLGERQLWLCLTDESSLEVTHETAGLAPDQAFWSITHHASSEQFDKTGTDALDRFNLANTATFADALDAVMAILENRLSEKDDALSLVAIGSAGIADLLHAYDRYVQTANDVDVYASGWRPVSVSEFATHEYLNVWCETPADEREDCFAYLGDQ